MPHRAGAVFPCLCGPPVDVDTALVCHSPSANNVGSESRMIMTAEAQASIHPSMTTTKCMEDEQEEQRRVRVPMEAVAAMMSEMQRRENGSMTGYDNRVIQGGQNCKKRKSPCSNNIMFRSLLSRMMLSSRPRIQFMPSPRSEIQRSRKKKSPCFNMGTFRSPLSRMVLSPRLHLWVRSPSASLGTSSSTYVSESQRGLAEIDLNVDPIWDDIDLNTDLEKQVNLTLGLDHGEGDENEGAPPQRQKEVPKDTKKLIFDFLLAKAKSGELKGHETGEVSAKFSVNIRTVHRIWKDEKECLNQGRMVDFSSGNSKRGRKKKEMDLSKLRELPISSHGTLEDVSKELEIGKRKLHSLKKEGLIERVSNSIKSFLIESNKKERLKWCVSMLYPRSIPADPVFKDLFEFVFIDEKWFNITRKTLRYYKLPGEEQPTRTCKSTNFIPKIMILCAKWPREDANKPIYIQQDNAPSHIAPNDKLFCEAAKKDGFDIRLVSQPPNSPDLNILDLGFFSSIQSIQYKTSSKTTKKLVAAVHKVDTKPLSLLPWRNQPFKEL